VNFRRIWLNLTDCPKVLEQTSFCKFCYGTGKLTSLFGHPIAIWYRGYVFLIRSYIYFSVALFFNIGWDRYMSTINILVLTIFSLVKIVRKIRSLSHSSCTVFFDDPQGIIEIYYCLYLLDLKKHHPRCPQLSNELYL